MKKIALALIVLLLVASAAWAVTYGDLQIFKKGVKIGAIGDTTITRIMVYAPTLTPAASTAAIQTAEQTFTVTGLTTADKVFVNGPAPTSLCPPVTFRVSTANTLAIGFSTLTASACTPAAGVYNIVSIRN